MTVTEGEKAALEEMVRAQNTTLSELLTTSALAPKGALSRPEKADLMVKLTEARDLVGRLKMSLDEAVSLGVLSPEDAGGVATTLRRMDLNLREHVRGLA